MSQQNTSSGLELPHLTGLEARIAERIVPTLADLGYELVRLSVLGRDTPTIQIMADRANGSLISVEDCEQISHAVGAVLDVDDPIPGAWMLEVSSAGIDRPLTRAKDWERFAGHLAKAELDVPLNGRRRFSGTVMGTRDGKGVIRLDDGTEAELPLAEVRKARLILTDALIEASAALSGITPEAESDGETPRVPKLNPKKPGKKKQ
ncbi:ribosome maturation factor RimP [Gluconobacter cerinus]|uniref:Ribosome maturation factor RimP n=1 Tax=Gluconobacter cerinus TaxID=38307 RepID=A0A1B6VLN2_9PROT|nr:ribosome maturation factor RimP [Gluconobacter cerinus]OAJ68135.1 ribosome maturation protein RimP [Gluconobacter cerinus]